MSHGQDGKISQWPNELLPNQAWATERTCKLQGARGGGSSAGGCGVWTLIPQTARRGMNNAVERAFSSPEALTIPDWHLNRDRSMSGEGEG